MKQFRFTPSFMTALKEGIDGISQATVRDLCAAHVGKHTQSRFSKVMSSLCTKRMCLSVTV